MNAPSGTPGIRQLAEGFVAFVASIGFTVLVVWLSEELPGRDDVSYPFAATVWVLAIWLLLWLLLARRWALLIGLTLGFGAQILLLIWLLSHVHFE